MSVDNQVQQMMQKLGHALVQALASSAEVGDAVGKIRQEGYSLYLVLDPESTDAREARIELTSRQSNPKAATFVLDKDDVELLKSLGIDATRTGRQRGKQAGRKVETSSDLEDERSTRR